MNDDQLFRYSRHILMDEIDIEGQEKLLHSKVMVIGCGGLGNTAIPYLAASGVGQLLIMDHDTIELSNLQRQILFTQDDIGQPKADTLARYVKRQNPDCAITALPKKAQDVPLVDYMVQHDVIVDCTDNYKTRQLINHAAVQAQRPLVSGSAGRFEGQLAVYNHPVGQGPCYACLFNGEFNDAGASCAKQGIFAPVVGLIGVAQANEALKILLNIGQDQPHRLHLFNGQTFNWMSIHIQKNPQCPVCGKNMQNK